MYKDAGSVSKREGERRAAERGEGYKEMYRSPVMGGQASP